MPTMKCPGDHLAPAKLTPFLLKPKHKTSSLDDSIRMLKVAADTKDLKLGKIIHAQLIISNPTSTDADMSRTNSLVFLYVKCDQVSIARQLVDRMRKRNLVSWSALMAAYLHNGHALKFLDSSRVCGRVEEGKHCHGFVLKFGMVFHPYVKNALVHLYYRCLEIDGAMYVLNMVPGYDIISYNSVVNGLLENGHLKEAIEVSRMMVDDHVTWDSITYVTIFGLCARLKNLRLGLEVHGRMLKTEVECNASVSSAIIDMYGKCGRIINAMKMFGCLQTRNVLSWMTVMDAYFQNGNFEEALNLF
nr:pentatricopeptide repeat-containing protein At5g39680-like [Ziziphus jujuba var. spinosa]